MNRYTVVVVLSGLVCVASRRAAAQDRDRDGLILTNNVLGTTTVHGAHSATRVEGARTTFSRRDLERTQPLVPQEALRALPGVYVRDEDGMGLRFNVSLRGLDPTRSRRMVLLEDGMPTSINPYGEPDAYYNAPIDRMDHLELARGAGVLLFGPQTLGGVLNQVTPSPGDTPRYTLRLHAGLPAQTGASARWSGPVSDTIAAVVSVSHRRGVGFRAMGFEVTDLWSKLRVRLGRGVLTWRANVYREDSHSTYLGLTRAQFVENAMRNDVSADTMALRRYGIGLLWETPLGAHTRLRLATYAYATHRDWRRQLYDRARVEGISYVRVTGAEPGGAIYLRGTFRSNDRHYDVAGVEPRFLIALRHGMVRQALEFGGRVLVERALPRVVLDEGTPATRSLFSEELRLGLGLALFVQDQVHVGRFLTITPALRVERYAATRNARLAAGSPVATSGSNSAVGVMPGLAISVGTERINAFVGVHRGWAPPRTSVAISGTGADTQLDAEESFNAELGARVALGRWLHGEATAFWMNFENEVIPGSGAGAVTSEYINGGATQRVGVEVAGQMDLAAALGRQWSLYTDLRYTWIDARFTAGVFTGNVVPYAPPHTLRLALGVDVPAWGLGAQCAWSYTARHFADRANQVEESEDGRSGVIAPFHNIDLTVRYTHRGTGLGAVFAVRNLLDDVYVSTRLPDGIFPGGFRTLSLALHAQTP